MPRKLAVSDILAIQRLNARYAFAFDDLLPEPAAAWASTFTPNGSFRLLDANGNVQLEAKGTRELQALHNNFPNRSTTRHWYANLLIRPKGRGASMRCYFISLNVATKTILRTATYSDTLAKFRRVWKFKQRIVRLDQ